MQVRAKKFLGQHFLTDKNIAHKIVKALQTKEGAVLNVLEVGPGMGVLTDFMVTDQAISLSVIDIDTESIAYLEKKYPLLGDRIISGDFLNLAFEKLVEPGKDFAIIGNFPYNISSQILFKVLDNKENVSQVVGMFQKEVAERIVAKAGTKAYGILSVLMQADYEIDYLFTVNPGVFNPPPKVKSAVISALRNTTNVYDGANENLFREIVKAAFNQRRKTLRNALRKYLTPAIQDEKMFDLRAERLSVNDFVWLTKLISKAIDEKK
jgi:16S rRNA (adenine1518-N6/adenine1519-N6)-dimethyltransferase